MAQSRTDTRIQDDQPINYLPGGPTPSGTPGRIERFVRTLLRRRGTLRPVTRDDD